MQWIQDNWQELMAVAAGLYAFVSALVAVTPTPKDDEFFRKVMEWISLLTPYDAPGTLKAPLSTTRRR